MANFKTNYLKKYDKNFFHFDFNQFEIKPKIYTYFGFLALQQLKKIISFSVISF